MRFAWIQKTRFSDYATKTGVAGKAVVIAYNVVWWVPIILPLVGIISYRAGFIAFFGVTLLRAVANAYRVNILPLTKALDFPLRMPK